MKNRQCNSRAKINMLPMGRVLKYGRQDNPYRAQARIQGLFWAILMALRRMCGELVSLCIHPQVICIRANIIISSRLVRPWLHHMSPGRLYLSPRNTKESAVIFPVPHKWSRLLSKPAGT